MGDLPNIVRVFFVNSEIMLNFAVSKRQLRAWLPRID